jgi:DNA-binding IscR family transcriptional regulator
MIEREEFLGHLIDQLRKEGRVKSERGRCFFN